MKNTRSNKIPKSLVKRYADEAQKERIRNNWSLQRPNDPNLEPDEDKSLATMFNYDEEHEGLMRNRNARNQD